jgi:TRAP-type mannitol/chloroaromatic compound transport system permease small subunit
VKKFLNVVDAISEWTGSISRWLCIGLIAVATYDVIMRYVFNAPTVWAYEVSMMTGAAIYALGWAYGHLHKSHVRVDIIYSHLSARGQAILDIVCSLLFMFPLLTFLSISAISWSFQAWEIGEKMMESFWYPPAGPLRTIFAFGLILFLLQGVAEFIKAIYVATRGKAL